jgi:hypothetical protein
MVADVTEMKNGTRLYKIDLCFFFSGSAAQRGPCLLVHEVS